MPGRSEFGTIVRATRLFSRVVKLESYHDEDREERLESVFRHTSEAGDYGLHGQEAVSQFKRTTRKTPVGFEPVFGPWSQVFNLSNKFLGVTVVHELAHLVDRYHTGPRYAWSSGREEFLPLYQAYKLTRSSWIIANAREGKFFYARSQSGYKVSLPRDEDVRKQAVKRAWDMSCSNEVFARCLTAHVFYSNMSNLDLSQSDQQLCTSFIGRVQSPINQLSGYDLSQEDYEHIRAPLHNVLSRLGWTSNG